MIYSSREKSHGYQLLGDIEYPKCMERTLLSDPPKERAHSLNDPLVYQQEFI